jgi:ESCRT-I complex subunit VPS37
LYHPRALQATIIEITDVKLKQFQKNLADRTSAPTPPAPTTSTTTSSTTTTTRPTGSTSHPPIHQKEKKPNPKPNFDVSDEEIEALIPSIPPSFPTIESMSSSEIKRLMRTQSQLDSFIEQTNEVQTLREIKLGIEQSNVDMAKSNLQHETQLEEMQSEILALEMEVTSQLQHYNTLHARRVSMTEPPSVQTVISEMNVAKKEAYRLSESLADRWIESGGGSSSTGSGGGSAEDVGDFVKQFMEMRTLYHCRAAKIERLENSTATLQKKDSIFPPLL